VATAATVAGIGLVTDMRASERVVTPSIFAVLAPRVLPRAPAATVAVAPPTVASIAAETTVELSVICGGTRPGLSSSAFARSGCAASTLPLSPVAVSTARSPTGRGPTESD
jgi:hypothetical protein